MEALSKVLRAFIILQYVLAEGANAQKIDLSTDAGVLAELQKRADAKPVNPGQKGGRKLEARFVCIERLKESTEVIVIGFFAYDRGCRLDGAFVGSRYYEDQDAALSRNALATLGWAKAHRKNARCLRVTGFKKACWHFSQCFKLKIKI